MKIRITYLILMFSINSIFSQEKPTPSKVKEIKTNGNPENGKIENGIYLCQIFDWKIMIPEGFEITDLKSNEELENVGYEAVKKEGATEIKLNPHPNHLIGFRINEYNSFDSNFESLKGTKKMTLEEHKIMSQQLLKDIYSKIKEFNYELTSSDLKMGQYSFYRLKIRLYNIKNNELLLTQEIYSSFIEDHLFTASINYTNENIGMRLNYNLTKSFDK